IGRGWPSTLKVESHNHPSYIGPYHGAATGVGGSVRDIMAMGARPVGVMHQLRFGAADAPDTRRVVDGVVRGIGGYGNSRGLPNIGGETAFGASSAGNPLGNPRSRRALRQAAPQPAFASRTRHTIRLVGRATVPLRAAKMTPAEILSSESQERMCAVVTPENVDKFMAVCRKWEVLATVIGEVTDGDRLQITWHGEMVVDVPPRTVAHEGPVYQRPVQRPDTQDALNADT